jgi:homoserine kinase type II
MALYTPFEKDDLVFVTRMFNLGELRDFEGIPQGSINTNYRLDTDQGRFFMRHTTVRSENDLRFEAALLDHLDASRFPSPTLVCERDGSPFITLKGGRVSVFHYLVGEELSRQRLNADHLERLGIELGKLHRITHSFTGTRDNPYDHEVVRGWLVGLERHSDTEIHKIASELLTYLESSEELDRALQPQGVIHADLFIDNVKWVGDYISAFFDFEMACRDAYALDLAITLNAWCFDQSYQRPLCRALLRGYQTERPLGEPERDALFSHALFGAVRYTTSRIRDFHLSPLGEDRLQKKSFRTYLERTRALVEMGPEEFQSFCGLDA